MSPNVWLFCAVCQTCILMEPAKVGMIVLSQRRRYDKSCSSSRRRTKSMNAAAGLPVLYRLPRGTVKRQLRRKLDHDKREKLTNFQIETQLQHGFVDEEQWRNFKRRGANLALLTPKYNKDILVLMCCSLLAASIYGLSRECRENLNIRCMRKWFWIKQAARKPHNSCSPAVH